jgi:glyoxylase-like metal-dependent hydrolase (beta-lactamase superfamily II)
MKKYQFCLFILCLVTFTAKAQSQPGYYNLMIGDDEVIAISDGTVPVNAKQLLNNDPKIPSILKQAFLTENVETSINTFVIKADGRLILVDAGSGELMGPYGGKLITCLHNAGIKPEDITDVLLTHVHIDHSGGLSIKGQLLFPHATIHVNQKDIDFWKAHETPLENDNRGIKANRVAYLALKPYLDAGRVKTFSGNVTLFPGIDTYEAAGHMPGHTLYRLQSRGEKIVFIGDMVHIAAVQLAAPAIPDEYDFDKVKGAAERSRVYADIATGGYLVAAAHISFPGVGHFIGEGKGYVWVPVNYSAGK